MEDNKTYRFEIEDPESGLHMMMSADKQFIDLMDKVMEENPGMSRWEACHQASQMRIAEADKKKEQEQKKEDQD